MPENVGAAILSKIERIFLREGDEGGDGSAAPDRFVAFHVPAMPYDPKLLQLVNGADGAPTVESSRQQRAFAELVNMVPAPAALYRSDGALAWESYGAILTHGRLARSALSEAEQAELAAADALLYAADGNLSAAYETYLELQRRWETRDEEVRNLRLGIAASDDPAYREAQAAALAEAEEAREQALAEWVGRGRRFEIEAAIATKIRLGARALHDHWQEREQRFEEGMRADPDFGDFWRTGFAPQGVVDDDAAWSPITIDRSEISGLVAAARDEVRRAAEGWSPDADANQTNVEIERITMRALKLDVTRPWFDPSLFASRFWRLPAHMPPVSDGATPPAGSLPAYVASLVLVKDIDITLKPASAANDRLVRHVQAGRIGLIGPFAVRAQRAAGTPTTAVRVRALDVGRMVEDGNDGDAQFRAAIDAGRLSNASLEALRARRTRPVAARPRVVDHRSPAATPAVRVRDHRTAARPRVVVRDHRTQPEPAVRVRDHRTSARPRVVVRDHRTAAAPLVRRRVVAEPGTVGRRPPVVRVTPGIVTAERPTHVVRVRRGVPAPRPPVREPSVPPTTRPGGGGNGAEDDTVFVVAFLCARTPRSPDPDESLVWT